jgi:CpXC motif protein
MSLFRTEKIKCPGCGQSLEYGVVYSVNADRRPDLREAILNSTFQRTTCEKCGETFRLEPRVTYLDLAQHQWILVESAARLMKWAQLEKQARSGFEQTYGATAPAAARELGASLQPRVTFGWSALKEKVLAAKLGLDDATLELAKLSIIRWGGGAVPLADDVELRLIDAVDDSLVLAWLRPATGEVIEAMRVARGLLSDIDAQSADWQALRDELTAGPFVDIHRVLVASKA